MRRHVLQRAASMRKDYKRPGFLPPPATAAAVEEVEGGGSAAEAAAGMRKNLTAGSDQRRRSSRGRLCGKSRSLQKQRTYYQHWRQQCIHDKLIEVVGFKSLFHLGQVQVGLATPVRICQGRNISITLPQKAPLQIDGEPMMLQEKATLKITYDGETPVLLAPDKSAQTRTLAAVQQVLATAYSRGLLNEYQCTQLLKEFQRKL